MKLGLVTLMGVFLSAPTLNSAYAFTVIQKSNESYSIGKMAEIPKTSVTQRIHYYFTKGKLVEKIAKGEGLIPHEIVLSPILVMKKEEHVKVKRTLEIKKEGLSKGDILRFLRGKDLESVTKVKTKKVTKVDPLDRLNYKDTYITTITPAPLPSNSKNIEKKWKRIFTRPAFKNGEMVTERYEADKKDLTGVEPTYEKIKQKIKIDQDEADDLMDNIGDIVGDAGDVLPVDDIFGALFASVLVGTPLGALLGYNELKDQSGKENKDQNKIQWNGLENISFPGIN